MVSRLEELKLISQCVLVDDRHAFGTLVEAYQPQVRRFLLNLTHGDEMLTDDLAQETFIKAYVNLRSFKGLSAFGTWLYRIAYNEFCSHSRHTHEQRLGDEAPPDEASEGSERAADAQMTVQAALQLLPVPERTAITLFYIEDLPIKKIARVMDTPENTVKSHLRRAKEKLRNIIGDID